MCAIAAGCGGWLLAGGDSGEVALPGWMSFVTPAAAAEGNTQVRLEVISEPTGATVSVDGHQRGTTPLSLSVANGVHTLVLKHAEAIDAERQLSIAGDMRVNVNMWLRRPTAMLLKPAYPGATITDGAFLQDGRLALSMANPAESTSSSKRALQEAWIYDPRQASLAQFTTKGLSPRAAKVAVSPDGQQLAYLQSDLESSPANRAHATLTEIWVASANTHSLPVRVFTLSMPERNSVSGSAGAADVEQVHDLTWTPDGQHLLVTLQLAATAAGNAPAPRSRLLLVDASPEQATRPVELITLPAQVVAGSYIWAPDGNWVAFLTQAPSGSGVSSFVALCAVDTSAGGAVSGFRYVADLGSDQTAQECMPESAILTRSNIHAQHFALAIAVDAHSDHDGHTDDPMLMAHFEEGRVQRAVRVRSVQLARAEALHFGIQGLTHAADLAFGDATHAQRFDQVIDSPRTDALYVRFLDDGDECPLTTSSWLEQRRVVAAVAHPRHT